MDHKEYRIMGAPSRYTPGYILGYASTETAARRRQTYYRNQGHTTVWIQRRMDNGEYAN
jgi:hypothetical protein